MSTLNVANITDGTDTVETGYVVNGSAKAWVNFNGTGTVAIRNSLNVASITDQGTGDYDINISNAMSGADYAYAGAANGSGSSNAMPNGDTAIQASKILIRLLNTADARQDSDEVYIIAHGDLA